MFKTCILLLIYIAISQLSFSQTKSVFSSNVSFTIPVGWYMKDSSATKVTLRKTGDDYSKIEIKIYAHKEKDLAKYVTLDKKKFMPDPHTRTVLPDANLGGKAYKKVKYITKNAVLKVDTDLEYVSLFKPRIPLAKTVIARLEIINTYHQSQEAVMVKVSDALVAGMKY